MQHVSFVRHIASEHSTLEVLHGYIYEGFTKIIIKTRLVSQHRYGGTLPHEVLDQVRFPVNRLPHFIAVLNTTLRLCDEDESDGKGYMVWIFKSSKMGHVPLGFFL